MDAVLRDRVRAFFDDVPAALVVYVFGSVARSTLSLEGRLAKALESETDLVVLNTASADLVHRVLRDGELVVDRDPSRRIQFEVARRNEYFDLQRIRDEYRRMPARTSVPPR